MPEEDRAGMADFVDQRARLFDGKLQVLGCDTVGDDAGLVEIGHVDQRAATGNGRGDDVLARHGRQQPLDARRHLVEISRVWTEQNGLGQLVVLGLGE